MLISCVLQCTDGLRLIKRLENYAYRMSEKTAYRSLEKSAYRSLKKLLTVHLQIHLTACTQIKAPGMLQTAGKFMTLKMGCELRKIDVSALEDHLINLGYTING